MLFLYYSSSVIDIDYVKLTIMDLSFSRLVLELGAKETFKRLIKRLEIGYVHKI